ncbi:hypothetical protein PENSOL_c011G01140 [Penicillium solitum]|uniref:FAD-binding domain-containing protein n=1 Tax=Penicillium solitum TaxID=60172 RepID=A0A1V6R8S0_9EURO|nr:uncharacterized protein PENSOL_c011G01140 [Penicillium solitum]OQD97819.1 hypothetical protein PENSOL_c011G01140 [Penicillium solitum]
METKAPMKVIIVGGAIAGLTLAHSLKHANIDYQVIDAYPIASPVGASIAIFQNGCMVLDQLGIYQDLRSLVHPLKTMNIRLPSGKVLAAPPAGTLLEQRFGYSICLLPRQRLIQLLYDHLEDKSKVHAGHGKKVIRVAHSTDGVEVFTEDGSSYSGDVVVGCDGIHSSVRSEMWRHAELNHPGIPLADRSAFASEFTCLFGIAGAVPGLPPGESNIVHGKPASFLTFIGLNGDVYFFLYMRMSERHLWPDSPRFSQEQGESLANAHMGAHITEDVTFGDIWTKRKTFTLLPMEEGVLQDWHWGRFAVVGDAAHKMTVNLGQGGNSAIESAAALANALNEANLCRRGDRVSQEEIEMALSNYQESRRPRLVTIGRAAFEIARSQALEGLKPWLFFSRVFFDNTFLADLSTEQFLGTVLLNYIRKPIRLDNSLWLQGNNQSLTKPPSFHFFACAALVLTLSWILKK